MDEIKIKDIEEKKPEPVSEIKTEKVTSEKETHKDVPKKFIYLVAAIVIIIIALASFTAVKNYIFPTTGNVITVSELFLKNLQGELPEEEGYMYNGFSFILFDGLWYTEVQFENKVFQVPLHFGPQDLEDVPVTGFLTDDFEKEEVYLTFNPLTSDDYVGTALSEIAQNLAMAIHRKPIGACDQNETAACTSRPIINCSNKDKAVIHLIKEPGPEIELKGNCIVIRGQNYDIIKAADRLILEWYEVFNSQ